MLRLNKNIFLKDKNDNFITEEELEHIHPDINQNFPYPKMNSGLITVHNNGPEIFIDDTEYFFQYRSWLLSGHKGNTLHTTTIKSSTAHLYGG